MRKNKLAGKNLKLYSVFVVKGANVDYLLNRCVKRGLILYNVKKRGEAETEISVKYCDREKFFAITKDLCYNNKKIIKIKERGLAYPFFYLAKNIGLILGAILFCVFSYCFNDLILNVKFTGSGSVFKEEVRELLKSEGIDKFSRFSKTDLKRLEDKIVIKTPDISFSSVQKDGNTLLIRLEPSNSKLAVTELKPQLTSDVTGVIEDIKVYRGTAVKNIGDTVSENDVIVEGYMSIKEQVVETGVIATATVVTQKEFTYVSKNDGEEEKAQAFAMGQMIEEIINTKTEKIKTGEEYKYLTTVYFRHYIYS